MPQISIQLNSNRPVECAAFFDNIESTASRPEDIEVLLHIDTGDTAMEAVVARETPRRRFTLRVLQTDLVKGYVTLWKPLNPLFAMTHSEAYFVANLFDEIRFETRGWDRIILGYRGYYADDIFRLRTSQFRFRNYTDVWQCGFAPDSSAFYTRRWLELSGDWCPCMGPDSFQQCVAFYMYTHDPFEPRQFYRDVPVPDIRFSGEGASVGLSGEALERRNRENNRLWFRLMSHAMQEEARRRAMRLNSHIVACGSGGVDASEVVEDIANKSYFVRGKADGRALKTFPYGLSRARIAMTNLCRAPWYHYYGGGGREILRTHPLLGIWWLLDAYCPFLMRRLSRKYRKAGKP